MATNSTVTLDMEDIMAKVWGKKAKNRQAIIRAAKQLFEEKGDERVTFNDIADAAGMSRTTIFNHFPTINSLLIAMCEDAAEKIREYSNTSRLTGSEKIVAIFNRAIEGICEAPIVSAKMIGIAMTSPEVHSSLKSLIDIVEESVEGDMDQAEREDVAIRAGGCFLGLLAHQFGNEKSFDENEMKMHFATLIKGIL